MNKYLLGQSGWKDILFKGHRYTNTLLKRFPDFESESEEGYIYPIRYEKIDQLRECASNLTSCKGRHPAQDAFITIKETQRAWDLWCECSGERSVSEANYYYPNALENYKLAQKTFEEALLFEFVRDDKYQWILQKKLIVTS